MNWFTTVTETHTVTKHVYVGPLSEWVWILDIAIPALTAIIVFWIVFWGMNSGALPRP